MKLPSFQQAHDALSALATLTGREAELKTAESLVGIVTDLFDDKPKEQAALKSAYANARERTDAALDRLDGAIDKRLG